jgi:hypothetical protein
MDNERNWRFRQELADQLRMLVPLFSAQEVKDFLSPIALVLIQDKVSILSISWFFFWGGGQRPLVPLLLHGPPFFLMILFLSTTLLTGMTCISLHMRWPLTLQSHGSFLKENNFLYESNFMPLSN